jgi:hypothetical protein
VHRRAVLAVQDEHEAGLADLRERGSLSHPVTLKALGSHRMTPGHWKQRIFLTISAKGDSAADLSKSPVSDR